MGISYNEAKGLINKGKKRRDGGSTVLESYMPIVFEGMKKKKKKVPMPKPRPKNLKKKDPFRADKTISLNREFSKRTAKANEDAMKSIKKSDGGSMRKPRMGEKSMRKQTAESKAIRKFLTQIDMIPINIRKSLGVKGKAMGGLEKYEEGGVKKKKMKLGSEFNKPKKKKEDPPRDRQDPEVLGRGQAPLPPRFREVRRKEGGSFPDLSGDGKVTQKDILIGRGVIKKKMGGIARGGGAAISGTGFKGVY